MKRRLLQIVLILCGLILNIFIVNQILSSSDFMYVELKALDSKIIQNNEINIHWYATSSITTIHEHVEVSKAEKTQKIAELNQGGIDSIYIHQDTIHIETNGNGLFYTLDKSVFNYTIVLDTIR